MASLNPGCRDCGISLCELVSKPVVSARSSAQSRRGSGRDTMKFVICCLLLLSLASAQEKNVFESVKAARDTALEMNPSSSFWRDARPVYARVDANGNTLAEYQTEVRSRWTGS